MELVHYHRPVLWLRRNFYSVVRMELAARRLGSASSVDGRQKIRVDQLVDTGFLHDGTLYYHLLLTYLFPDRAERVALK